MLEPRALFDPFALQTTSRRPKDGGYVLDGVKALVPGAAKAELFIVAAQLEGTRPGAVPRRVQGQGRLHRARARHGRARRRDRDADARRTSSCPAWRCSAAATRRSTPSASTARGWPGARSSVGTAQAVLDHVIPYVNERKAFGEPISHRQAVAFAVSDIAIELEGMRLATWRAAALADQGKDFAHAAAVARRLCATKGTQIGSQGVQLLGGHGYVKEYPVERWYRDLRAAGVMEGALLV